MPTPGHAPDCFVCGFLGIEVEVADGRAVADLLLDSRFTGPAAFAHGGITAALFDELLGAAVCDLTATALTAHLEVDYRRPWPIGAPARMTAQAAWSGERKIAATAELVGADGTVLAESRGLWVVARGS